MSGTHGIMAAWHQHAERNVFKWTELMISGCVAALLIVAGGCPFQGEVYEDHLVAGYVVWASDVIEDAAIYLKYGDGGGAQVVPAMVFAYGWNDEFIIAKRRSTKHSTIKGNAIQWYLIQVQNRRVHGPLSEDEFAKLRTELHVPSDLSFTKETRLRRGESRGIQGTPY